jgi:predicted ATPase
MLREFAEVLEVLTAETPLVLILEDLHWSDYATLDVLTVLARRREPACLLVLGTYRPLTMLEKDHPLQTISQELLLHGYCTELPLSFLSAGAVATYLMVRLPGQKLPVGLVSWLHQYTGGNPLFLVTMVEHLLEQGWLEEVGEQWKVPAGLAEGTRSMPKTLRQLIETQLAQLGPEERQLLKVGSVVGEEFSSAAVAAGIATDVRQVEAWAEGLVRREHFLRAQGIDTWADGTVTARYRFLHTLYQQVIYDLIPPVHRQQLHQQIGLRLEQGYGEWVVEIAAELARHFAEAQDYQRTVHYRRLSQLVRWVTRTVRP